MLIGLVTALLAALAYGGATILQAVGVGRIGDGARASGTAAYAAGLGLDLAGFAVSVVALRTLPLFLVESAVASSVAVTAVLAVVLLGVRLRRAEVVALALVLAGLVALAGAATSGTTGSVPAATTPALWVGVAVTAGLLVVGWRSAGGAVVLSTVAGLGFGGVGIAARVLPALDLGLLGEGRFWALVVLGALGTVGYALGLDRGRVTTVAAITFAVETLVPSAVGLLWLDDRVRPGLGWLAALGLVVTLGACVRLAGRAEPGPAPQSTSPST